MTTPDVKLPQLRLSASQIETAKLCVRKWFLGSVLKLPEPQKGTTTFGTVLHSVVERLMRADDRGYDPATGKPVELYPEGWHVARSRWNPAEIDGEVSPAEQDKIKQLVKEAILAGYLERRAGRQVEQEFQIEVAEGITLSGFIDLIQSLDPEASSGQIVEVVDHKSTKSMRYAKTPKTLMETHQMLIYACVGVVQRRSEGMTIAPGHKVLLRHNVFCKDDKDVRVKKVEAEVTAEYLETYWQGFIVPMAQYMQQVKANAKKWDDIPWPEDRDEACNAYGGCAYRNICNQIETEEQYRARMEQAKIVQKSLSGTVAPGQPKEYTSSATSGRKKPVKSEPPANAGEMDMSGMMSFQNMLASQKPATPSGPVTVAPSINPPMQHPGAMQPSQPPMAQAVAATFVPDPSTMPNDIPPWAKADCGACRGTGFNTKGNACRICVAAFNANPNPSKRPPTDFTIAPTGNGCVEWVDNSTRQVVGRRVIPGQEEAFLDGLTAGQGGAAASSTAQSPPMGSTPPPAAAAPQMPVQPVFQPQPPVQQHQQQAPTPEPAPVEAEEKKAKGGKRGRPTKPFVLIAGCLEDPSVGSQGEKQGSGRYVYLLSEVLKHTIYPEMCRQTGKESYLDISVWDRRDMIARVGEQVATMFANDIVLADGMTEGQSDMRSLFDAIKPFAGKCFIKVMV